MIFKKSRARNLNLKHGEERRTYSFVAQLNLPESHYTTGQKGCMDYSSLHLFLDSDSTKAYQSISCSTCESPFVAKAERSIPPHATAEGEADARSKNASASDDSGRVANPGLTRAWQKKESAERVHAQKVRGTQGFGYGLE